jgi:hypothetical protein
VSDAQRGPRALPHHRPEHVPPPPEGLPRQRRGVAPQGRSRYPDYDVLEQADHWDDVTREVVLDRVHNVPPIRFFTEHEAETLGCFCDVVTAQDREPRIPVLAMVDKKLHEGKLDGYQYSDMPDDRETWRLAARGLDERARALGARDFADADPDLRLRIVEEFHAGDLHDGVWAELPAKKAFSVLMRAVLSEFYSHPWAWNEIGFGGPAYPRGYARLGVGLRESWEGEEEFHADPVRDVQERGIDL